MPLEKIKLQKTVHTIPAKVRGHMSNKWNRAAKLMSRFDELDAKFRGMVDRGGYSEHGRLALATLLLMHTGIRVGNESSAEGYMTKPHPMDKSGKKPELVHTYGLTTLLDQHVQVLGETVVFEFVGKKQVANTFNIRDHCISRAVCEVKTQCEGGLNPVFGITGAQLTRFIKTYVGARFSPKDFRTMRAHIEASTYVKTSLLPSYEKKADLKAAIKGLFVYVSGKLNNLPGTVKKSYLTPSLPEILLTTRLAKEAAKNARK